MAALKIPSRRLFLRHALCASAAFGAPFAVRPGRAQAAAPLNLLTVFVPDGVVPGLWYPKGGETGFSLGEMSDPLVPVQEHCVFFQGLSMYGGEPSHPGGTRKVLTATGPQSLDVVVGQKLKGAAPFESIQLGVASNFENGSGTVSFVGPGQEAKPDDNPLNAFKRLFGQEAPGGGGGTPGSMGGADVDLLQKQKKSILDVVAADLQALQNKLGSAERNRLDRHLQSVRDVEARLAGLGMPPGGGGGIAACDPMAFNQGGYRNDMAYYPQTYHKVENFETVGQLQTDLAVLALACGLTRAVTIMWSHAVSPTKIASIGGTIGNHDASHYGTNPQSTTGRQYVANRRWFMGRFAGLVQTLKATPYGDGTLLDHTVVLLCSDINDGDLHDHRSLPFVVAGGARAGIRGGRFLDYTGKGQGGQNETHAKLLVSIARALGDPVDTFGYTAMGSGGLAGFV